MHYIPLSTAEMLQGEGNSHLEQRSSFHLQSAPLYVLTAIVGALLLADVAWPALVPALTRAPFAGVTIFGYRLALLAAVIGGSRILYQTLDGLLSGRVGADLALTISCLAAMALGEYQTAGLVVFVSLIGESIEGYTVDRARWAIRQTFNVWPTVAHRQEANSEQDVPTEQLRIGDLISVRPGERIPADGQVMNGTSTVDQSQFTGESIPVAKTAGDVVFAGTLNQLGSLTVIAQSVGESTQLAEIARLVATATSQKAQIQRTADRLAKWFLPVVLAAALLTLVGWRIQSGIWARGLMPALAVLVVACPCPLILATPCAVMAMLAALARRGIIVKGSAALERLAEVDTMAFDKTGTLTQGALELGQLAPIGGYSADQLLLIAAIAERQSEHVIGRAIVAAAEKRQMSIPFPQQLTMLPGAGIVAQIPSHELNVHSQHGVSPALGSIESDRSQLSSIVVGNRRAMDESRVPYEPEIGVLLDDRERAGEMPLLVAVNAQMIGVIGIREAVRAESRQVVEELRAAGVQQFALLTGDHRQQAEVIAQSIGCFEHVATEQSPAEKADWVHSSRQAGRHVAMVGDGINDAPALAAADVGIAVGSTGGNLAATAGDILLLGDPLSPLPGLLRASRALVQNIWHSILVFAFGVNAIGVLICAVRWLDPIGGAMFHELASLAVMANAMRLLWTDAWQVQQGDRHASRWLESVDRWANRLSPSRWVYWTLEHWRIAAKLTVAAAAAAWLVSGIYRIAPDQQAVVSRFGHRQAILDAGLYWRWPWPLERVVRANVYQVRSVSIGFLSNESGHAGVPVTALTNTLSTGMTTLTTRGRPAIVEWTSSHDGQIDQTGESSLMLTADEVPVELTAEVQYRIRNLDEFLFTGSQHPNEVIRLCAENVLREVAAGAELGSLLTDRRRQLERQSLNRLRNLIEAYQLGIEVLDLQWLDVHPPRAVVPDYRRVADAVEERELQLNRAKTYFLTTLITTVGESALRQLQSKAEPVDRAQTGILPEWKLTSELWRSLVDLEAAGQHLAGSASAILAEGHVAKVEKESSAKGSAQRFERLLQVYLSDPPLTMSSLYWRTIVDVLRSRTLTIVDPKLTGRRQLWVGDPPITIPPRPTPPVTESKPQSADATRP